MLLLEARIVNPTTFHGMSLSKKMWNLNSRRLEVINHRRLPKLCLMETELSGRRGRKALRVIG